ncbi:MAG: hypothetical protein N2246_00585, partial [Candidatus Sumerlaeia bacterium]|nr:hypothetical protein [Candidatus Sumerlaeia bacterium]
MRLKLWQTLKGLFYHNPEHILRISSKLIFASGLILGAMSVYLITMPSTIYWGDGIELTTSAYFLGIPH